MEKRRSFVLRTSIMVGMLLYTAFLQAQVENKGIVQRFQDYNQSALPEKIYLHTDKDFYMAGEILWFKAYSAEGFFHQPLDISKVLYVDVLDRLNNSVLRTKVSLDSQQSNGSIQLPLSLNSGNYRIRAYTSWMKNFNPVFFFDKTLTIVNPLKGLDSVPARGVTKNNYAAYFLPEGGHLVTGLESTVGFKITDDKGLGVEARGWILNSKNDTVGNLKTHRFGMGSFSLKPVAGESYVASVQTANGDFFLKELPVQDDMGYVMKVSTENDGVIVTVKTNIRQSYHTITIVAHTRGILKFSDRTSFNEGTATFRIERKNLGAGISQITAFVNEGQPVCERLYFIQPQKQLNLTVSTNKNTYTSREKVSLDLASKTGMGNPVPADLSVSVFRVDSGYSHMPTDIHSYFWLQSDLAGRVENPAYYFSSGNSEVAEAAEHLMLVHGWRRFNWNDITSGKKPVFNYTPEFKGHMITGRVIDTRTGRPAPGIETFLSVPETKFGLYLAVSDSAGQIFFDVKDYYGAGELIALTNTGEQQYYRVEINNPYAETYSKEPLPPFSLTNARKEFLEQNSIGMQVQQVYRADSLRQYQLPAISDTFPFFGRPAFSYNLDEYTRFTTMEEVLREYVREVNVVLRNGNLQMKIFNENRKDFFEEDMLVLLDGVPLTDPNKIFTVDPLLIKRVQVIPRMYVLGPAMFNGIASFSSYTGNFETATLNPALIRIDYEGLQLRREFFSPVYDGPASQSSRIPDFRNTLFWQPEAGTDGSGNNRLSFYTSDQKGMYIVLVEGMDNFGHGAGVTTSFEVK